MLNFGGVGLETTKRGQVSSSKIFFVFRVFSSLLGTQGRVFSNHTVLRSVGPEPIVINGVKAPINGLMNG